MRTLVDIPEQALAGLAEVARRRGTSRAGIIREAIADFLTRQQGDALQGGFGLWGTGAGDGLDYQRRIRDEW